MTLRRLLRGSSVPPETVAQLNIAYGKTLRALNLVDRDDPVSEIVARRIIEIANAGVRDPGQICRMAVEQLEPGEGRGRVPPPGTAC
ncbi:hypothetical protein [Bradyrhizobium sp. BR13661]|jgi:hypothetical protein|uniref:hypothetical protein n=1 Tax=Bradyrhizobium sp. BR13661 TaxID=2940622 RepID=UPI0024731239|nr:hypothetical protein [Bradyrhizobium sp. BR13661]MDH6257482.1 hypothetical protein [Bradyrhizobium sp. BR13661]